MNLEPTHKYEKIKFIGDGTYSNVYKVRSRACFPLYVYLLVTSDFGPF